MSNSTGPEWSGDMLDRPEMVEAFAAQLRRALAAHADYVAHIRRDAEAMWAENPPPEYSTFEAWWRHGKVTKPFAEIQEHLEKAAKLTFRLEARYRKNRHVIPEKRQAAAQAKQEAAALSRGQAPGRLSDGQPYPKPRTTPAPAEDGGSFMDMVHRSA
ncbi:hypothetical protein EDD27_1469 [Nonomuraea polychroma]|uniref:Uncharacterized protein n=1 Tax=Nonomuraea polychroma TaxID=46176 RepID=A0A438M008_9ACTN|nr:hypothetical protein [Nonomuraea polychroma]RVX39126.1 hypothetical protein EDD27_1469 [Nonomuraea polychroma]